MYYKFIIKMRVRRLLNKFYLKNSVHLLHSLNTNELEYQELNSLQMMTMYFLKVTKK